MNGYVSIVILSLTILLSGNYIFCSADANPSSEREVSEEVLSLFRRDTSIRIKDHETGRHMRSRLGAIDDTPRLSAEQLKPLVQRIDDELFVPAYNAADCALILRILRTVGSPCEYKLFKGCTCLVNIPADMQSMEIKDALIEGDSLAYNYRVHRSVYLAKDMLPISDALIFAVNLGKIALSVGEKMPAPDMIEDSVHYSTLE